MGQMQTNLEALLRDQGRLVHKELAYPRRRDFCDAELMRQATEMYFKLGGALNEFELNIRSWDMEFEGVAIELDEYLHFNRYRLLTLGSPLYQAMPAFPLKKYTAYCNDHEGACLSAGSYGGKWSSKSTEKQFGPAGVQKDLSGNGAPRWKQRAFYDFIKDLSPQLVGVKVARVAVWDRVWENGEERLVSEVLKSPSDCSGKVIAELIKARIV